MKKLLLGLLILGSFSVYSQSHHSSDTGLQQETRKEKKQRLRREKREERKRLKEQNTEVKSNIFQQITAAAQEVKDEIVRDQVAGKELKIWIKSIKMSPDAEDKGITFSDSLDLYLSSELDYKGNTIEESNLPLPYDAGESAQFKNCNATEMGFNEIDSIGLKSLKNILVNMWEEGILRDTKILETQFDMYKLNAGKRQCKTFEYLKILGAKNNITDNYSTDYSHVGKYAGINQVVLCAQFLD